MGNPINISALTGSVITAASRSVGRDVTAFESFARDQVQALAQQAHDIAAEIAAGDLSDADRDFLLADLKSDARDFADTLTGLAMVEIEKVWNAAVTALWNAIGTAAGIGLPKPF